ncbi:MAG TPA: hypothetical protein VFE32_04235 [Puia sp.]|jgi:hypothetical protein|nr:hypothetical protein [Puia sp.]
MATSKIKYSPSINIIRDSDYVFNYVVTANATNTFTSILNNARIGIKSHVMIGAYGTGKSSFLLSLKQTLEGKHLHFKGHQKLLDSIPKYEFLSVVGEYASLEKYFAKAFQLGKEFTTVEIIKSLDKYYKSLQKKGKGLAIVIDEFGKFLEYATKTNPESELYFIQQLAEWVNDSENDTLLITALHQAFSTYSFKLNKVQQQEWTKVQGRLKELPFNEPVEQLLFLAAQRIDDKFPNKKLDKNFEKLFETIRSANAFPLRDYFTKEFAQKLYPFDILSAAILAHSLQKYGQNERSLFSFIESKDHLGINDFDTVNNAFYSISHVYDYLLNGYYSYLTTRYNSDYAQWAAIRLALERAEGIFKSSKQQANAGRIIKTIGLLNIFASASSKLERSFYANYARYAWGINDGEEILKELEKKKIILHVKHSFRYILFEGTDLDIDLAIDDAGRLVESVTNVVDHLNQYFEFPFIFAKSIYYKKGTPRYFQFKLTEEPIKLTPESEVDGFINLVFSEDAKAQKKVEDWSLNSEEAILYGYYKNTAEIKNLLFEIQKIKKVKDLNTNDKIALRELDSIFDHYIQLLNHYVLDNLYTDNGNVSWFFKGKKQKITDRKIFNQLLSKICEEVYPDTPVYHNELINKTKLSGQIAKAKNTLVRKLITDLNVPNLGFTEDEFGPEKSIYLSLLRQTGIHQLSEEGGTLEKPDNASFHDLWLAGCNFLDSTKTKSKTVKDLIEVFSAKPFKLKQGLIDYWVPIFLLAKSEEYALFENNIYIADLQADNFELLSKKPEFFTIKAFDVVGIKLQLFNRYRIFLNQAESSKPTNKSFIQTIKPFLTFYRELPEYSKRTNRLDRRTQALRRVIATAKDPEKTFFEDFPVALGYNLEELQKSQDKAETFIKQLQEAIRQLRTCYDGLIDRFEEYFVREVIGSHASFPDYRAEIRRRFGKIRPHLLLAHQKPFVTRIQSELDDRKAWLSSIAQACIGKALVNISDEEELLVYTKLFDLVYELDNLSDIGAEEVDQAKEEIFKLEITTLVQGLNKSQFRIPKERLHEVKKKQIAIKQLLDNDKRVNLAILANLLQELITDE